MADQVRIAAIPGSLRTGAFNKKLVEAAAREAEKLGAQVEVVDLRALALPIYDEDLEKAGMPGPALRFHESLARAQGLLFSTPQYNGSIPGGLKNAIDWASRPAAGPNPFKDKPALVMGATPGPGGALYAQEHLKVVLGGLGAWTLPGIMSLSQADQAFDEQGALRDERKRGQLAKQVALLVQAVRQGVPKL